MSNKVLAEGAKHPNQLRRKLATRGAAVLLAGTSLAAAELAPAQPVAHAIASAEAKQPVDAQRLQRAATVDLRLHRKDQVLKGGDNQSDGMFGQGIEFTRSENNCTATHVGGGWFLTANHCFESDLHVGSQSYLQIYNAVGQSSNVYSAWKGSEDNEMLEVGKVDGLVVDGNPSHGDMAMVHLSNIDKQLPAVRITKEAPTFDQPYYITGYPQIAQFHREEYRLDYLGEITGREFGDTHGLNNDTLFYAFGVPKNAANEYAACQPGMSGSSVVNSQGEMHGVLSRNSDFSGWWQAAFSPQHPTPDDIAIVCLFAAVTPDQVHEFQSAVAVQPDPSKAVVFK